MIGENRRDRDGARQQQQKFLGRLAALNAEEDGDAAAAKINTPPMGQAVKVTGEQFVNLDLT